MLLQVIRTKRAHANARQPRQGPRLASAGLSPLPDGPNSPPNFTCKKWQPIPRGCQAPLLAPGGAGSLLQPPTRRRHVLEDIPRGSPVPPILLRLLLAQVSPPRPHCPLSQPWGVAQTAAADVRQPVHVSFFGLGEMFLKQFSFSELILGFNFLFF